MDDYEKSTNVSSSLVPSLQDNLLSNLIPSGSSLQEGFSALITVSDDKMVLEERRKSNPKRKSN
jgi:hypothetical protein